MKIRFMSDLHTEFDDPPSEFVIDKTPSDKDTTLILAGDIGVGSEGSHLKLIKKSADQFKNVIYITGNHEYYHGDIDEVDADISDFADELDNVHFLNPGHVIVDDVVIVGGTLWTGTDQPMDQYYARGMNDFRVIRRNDKRFGPNNALNIHQEHLGYIADILELHPNRSVVVVSHHTPSLMSSEHRFRDNPLTRFYYTDLERWIDEYRNLKLWIHGHVHNTNDYMIGDTRVVSNPRGYSGYELNFNFDPKWIIDV